MRQGCDGTDNILSGLCKLCVVRCDGLAPKQNYNLHQIILLGSSRNLGNTTISRLSWKTSTGFQSSPASSSKSSPLSIQPCIVIHVHHIYRNWSRTMHPGELCGLAAMGCSYLYHLLASAYQQATELLAFAGHGFGTISPFHSGEQNHKLFSKNC